MLFLRILDAVPEPAVRIIDTIKDVYYWSLYPRQAIVV